MPAQLTFLNSTLTLDYTKSSRRKGLFFYTEALKSPPPLGDANLKGILFKEKNGKKSELLLFGLTAPGALINGATPGVF